MMEETRSGQPRDNTFSFRRIRYEAPPVDLRARPSTSATTKPPVHEKSRPRRKRIPVLTTDGTRTGEAKPSPPRQQTLSLRPRTRHISKSHNLTFKIPQTRNARQSVTTT